MNQFEKILCCLESQIIHRLPDYRDGDKKRSQRKTKEILSKYKYDDDFIDEVNFDFCKGFSIAKEIIIDMFIAERERLEKIQQNVSLGDKIRSMSDEQLARFLTGQKDGEEFVAKLEELRTKQNTPLHQNSSY